MRYAHLSPDYVAQEVKVLDRVLPPGREQEWAEAVSSKGTKRIGKTIFGEFRPPDLALFLPFSCNDSLQLSASSCKAGRQQAIEDTTSPQDSSHKRCGKIKDPSV